MVGFNLPRIINALSILKDQKRGEERTLKIVKDYDVPNVSEKVLRVIISYVDYINRVNWFKL
jgi:UDP-N-acetylglucosamine 2-epimerase (non-hydrolysing)